MADDDGNILIKIETIAYFLGCLFSLKRLSGVPSFFMVAFFSGGFDGVTLFVA
jgi:hypothetical protein